MLHCLIIDDSEIVRKFSRLIFESLDFRVSEADSATAALERLCAECPDYIFVDWRMPDCNSAELISKIRVMPQGRRPHIVYVVTENDAHDIQRAIAHGANSLLLKPFNRDLVQLKMQEIRQAA